MPCPYPQDLMNTQNGIRLTATTMEAFLKGERVAAHARSHVLGGYTTLKEHMPSEHRDYAEWSPQRFIRWAGKIGVATAGRREKQRAPGEPQAQMSLPLHQNIRGQEYYQS